ncbi:LamG domain-containing protein [Candidatus Giovannonibacteria bacterium]|nr:LamG domain-containing protein [Candidatus Giovannonibacteria bacterium]
MNASFQKNIFTPLAVLIFSLFAGFQAVSAQSADLVSRWNGDAVSGTTVFDASGENNGTIRGGITIRPWEIGNNFHPDGSAGRIGMGNPENLNFGTGPFSLEAWFRLGLRGRGIAPGNIIRKSNYPVKGPGHGYWLKAGGDNRVLEFYVGETTGIPGEPGGRITTTISPDTWYHAVATRDGSGTMKLYVNGELKGTAEAPGADATSPAPFTLGAWDDRFGVTEAFFGVIGEVSVYRRALDSSEVRSLYEEGEEDFELYRTIEPYIKRGETPGQCKTVRGCRAYCDLEENFDECFDFAVKAGLIEIEDPYLLALRSGEAPGGCIGEDACAEYCGEAGHIKECVAFFAKFDVFPPDVLQMLYNLIAACEREPDFEACIESGTGGTGEPVNPGTGIQIGAGASRAAQTIQDAIQRGESPGKCKDETSCRTYCENIGNIQECLVFVEKFNLAAPDELKEMRQMAAAKRAGVPFPGNCKTKQSCLKYCEAPSHAVECVAFAEAAGFISGDEAAQARKFAPLIARGETPGKCATKDQCEAYCEQGAHIDECMDFAIEHDLFPPDELEIMKKIRPFMKAGTMPGGCKSKAECEAYCTADGHFEECLEIGLAIGVIKADEVDIIRKSGGKGPGNCRSREACDAYCANPDNQKECMDFAVKIGLMTREEAEQAQSAGDMKQCFEEVDDKIAACFITNLGVDMFEQMKAGKMPHDIAILERMRKAQACVKQYSDQATDVLDKFLKAMPVADSCIAAELGPDLIGRLRRMTVPCSQMKGISGKMEMCFQKGMNALFEACATKDCGEVQSCINNVGKSLSSITGQPEGGDRPEQGQKQEMPQVLQDKLNSCGLNFDTKTCLEKPTCKEFVSCLNPSENKALQGGDEPSESPPEIKARMDSCQQELVEIKMKEIQEKQTACLALSCSEFEACLKALQQGGGEQGGEQQQGKGTPDPAVNAKIQACQKEKVNACLAKPCGEFQTCLNSLGGGGGGEQQQGAPDPAVQAKFMTCFPPPPSGKGQ